ncbi:MAG TPA: aconitase family protein, partial [Acetobacteraceae bacterium]|nr:aconitase family protein [Acetobacteraceae bacterium]
MTETILSRASGGGTVKPGDVVVVDVETAVLMDMTFLPEGWREILKVHDPRKVAIVFDHLVPAPTIQAATAMRTGRQFAAKFGIGRLHDVGYDQGIAHAVVADRAYAVPGTVLVNGDSHTCAAGAFNCAARGVGGPDMLFAVTTGKAWFRLGETVRYDLTGRLPDGVSAKDIFLTIAGEYGAHVNQNVEYGGPGMSTLSINGRRTLATMGTELSAEFVIFEPDDALLDYVRARNQQPFEPARPDPDAVYADRRSIDLGSLEPLVALPDAVVNNSVKISQVAGQKIDQAFIGSCANGTLDDLEVAAR